MENSVFDSEYRILMLKSGYTERDMRKLVLREYMAVLDAWIQCML